MGALDRLASYSLKGDVKEVGVALSSLCDINSPKGYFYNSLEKAGYLVAEYKYKQGEEFIDESTYNSLGDEIDKSKYAEWTELGYALETEGNALAVSCAGSGKTTFLVFKIMKDILTGEAIEQKPSPTGIVVNSVCPMFVGTFLKSGAEELKQRVAYWQRKLGYMVTVDSISFGTLHAEFKRVLNAMGVATNIGTTDVIFNLLKQAVNQIGVCADGKDKLSLEDYKNIENIVGYYRNMIDGEKYRHPACNDYGLYPALLDSLVNTFANLRRGAGVMDFEDLQELLYTYLYIKPNKAVQDFVANRYKYIYLDEFQDTSQIQYAIIKFYGRGLLAINTNMKRRVVELDRPEVYFKETDIVPYIGDLYTELPTRGKLVCIGDDDQSIYKFRGADINIITKYMPYDFEPTITKMSYNYRCPSNILSPIIPSIVLNKNRYEKDLKAFNEGGEFNSKVFMNMRDMVMTLVDNVNADVQKGLDVAIICRTNYDGVIPAVMLEHSHKFKYSLSALSMTLTTPLPRKLLTLPSLLLEKSSFKVSQALELIASTFDRRNVYALTKALEADKSVGINSSIWTLPEDDIRFSCPSLYNIIGQAKGILNVTEENRGIAEIQVLQLLYFYLISNKFNTDSLYNLQARSYIEVLLYLLEHTSVSSAREFIELVDDYNERMQARVKLANVPVRIVTAHEFKGKEADSVYVWNDTDGVYPNQKAVDAGSAYLEEERRVHYIACTRAKKKCSVYGMSNKVGMFFKEMDCKYNLAMTTSGKLPKNKEINNTDKVHHEEERVTSILTENNIEIK